MTVIKLRRPKPAPVKREWGYQKMATNLLDLEFRFATSSVQPPSRMR